MAQLTATEYAAQVFVVINFAIIGLSHIVQPRGWVDFFVFLRERGHAGVFFNGMLSLMVGSIIVSLHNVWSGPPMLVTLLGWGQVFKGLVSLTVPSFGLNKMMRVSVERAWEFQVAGALFLVFCAVIVYGWLRA
jgi:hypothetical protein